MIKIREQINQDEEAVKFIISTATDEIRAIYRPIKTKTQNKTEKQINIVAIIKHNIVGTAEFFIYENKVLIQGLAVSPVYRRQGVAREIIEYVTQRTQKEGIAELTLRTIKETGNANAFIRMGFTVVSEEKSETYENIQGEPVTLVNMSKRV